MLPASVLATFPSRWPAALLALAGPAVSIPLDPPEVRALAAQAPDLRPVLGVEGRPALPDTLLGRLPALFGALAPPLFARVCPCSFKDGPWPRTPLNSVAHLVRRLQHPGGRAPGMLWRCLIAGAPVALTLKPWRAIAAEEEFRLFFRAGTLVGATPLHRGVVFADLPDQGLTCAQRIADFAALIASALHLPTVVADIALALASGAAPVLLELNPWHPFTDSGLFDWHDPLTFDHTLRLRGPGGQVTQTSLSARAPT